MKKFALLIGVDNYDDPDIAPLKYASNDALELSQKLTDICLFDEVLYLDNLNSTLAKILKAFDRISGLMCEKDLFMFFFSGHGFVSNEQSFLLTKDTILNHCKQTSLTFESLQEIFSKLEASKIIMLTDTCRNSPQAAKGYDGNYSLEAYLNDTNFRLFDVWGDGKGWAGYVGSWRLHRF